MSQSASTATALVSACAALLAACSQSGGASAEALPPIPAGLLLDASEWQAIPRAGQSAGCELGTPCARAWDNVLAWAGRWDDPGIFPDLTESAGNNSDHDVVALACALAWRGSDDLDWRERARLLLDQVVHTPYSTSGVSALRPGRNLLSYVLAASTIELSELDPLLDEAFRAWIERVAEVELWVGDGVGAPGGTFGDYQARRPNNIGLVVGSSRVAVEMYLGRTEHARHLVDAQRIYRGYLGDHQAYVYPDSAFGGADEDNSWQLDPTPGSKVGIDPLGAVMPTAGGLDVDGCMPEEMRRLGDLDCGACGVQPSILCYNRADSIDGGAPLGIAATGYPWEALQGLVMQAYLLGRCGYDSFGWSDAAIERALRFLYVTYGLRAQDTWSDATQADDPACCNGAGERTRVDDTWVPHIVRAIRAPNFLDESQLVYGGRPGKNCGFADWWTLGLLLAPPAAR